MGRQLSLAPGDTELLQEWADSFSKNEDVAKALKGNKSAIRRVRKKVLKAVKLGLTSRKELLKISKK